MHQTQFNYTSINSLFVKEYEEPTDEQIEVVDEQIEGVDEQIEVVRNIAPSTPKMGPPVKEWDKLGSDRKRKLTQKIYSEIEKTAAERQIESVQMVGNLLHR